MGNEKKNQVRLDTLTGEQFKALIEQFTQDGKIDTIPELLAFLSGIPEGMTLGEYIAQHAADPEDVRRMVDDAMGEQAENAYDAENRKMYLFGKRPTNENE